MAVSSSSAPVATSSPHLLAAFEGRRPDAPAWFTEALALTPERSRVVVQTANIEVLSWGNRGAPGLLLMHGLGAQKMTWAYALSGAIALALLVYLVVALFRAEDL